MNGRGRNRKAFEADQHQATQTYHTSFGEDGAFFCAQIAEIIYNNNRSIENSRLVHENLSARKYSNRDFLSASSILLPFTSSFKLLLWVRENFQSSSCAKIAKTNPTVLSQTTPCPFKTNPPILAFSQRGYAAHP